MLRKTLHKICVLFMVILSAALIFTACNKEISFKINFIVEEQNFFTIDTNGKEIIQMPNNPTKDGYVFDGWFWDDGVWSKAFTANSLLDAPLSSDMAVYAKFLHLHSDTDWELIATIAPTEDDEGNNTYRCKVCGETKTETIEKLEHTHNYDGWEYDETQHWKECAKDGEKSEINEHTYGDWKITTAPTCTQSGLRERVCTICGRKDIEDVSAKGHTEVIDNAVEPTCTETGLTEGKHCSVCNTVLVKQNVIAAKGHTEVIDKAVEPTCDKQGKTEGKHCSVCGTIIVAQQDVKTLDHTYDDGVITKEATEFEYGKKRYTCTVCGHYYEVDTPKLIIDRTGAELISANGFTIDGNSCSISLPNTTTVYSFIKQITVSDYATWTISTDIYGINNVATKTVSLNAGDNVVYLLITSGDGNNINLYTMTIRRRPIYRVNFVTNGGTSVNVQNVEETYLATEPTTSRKGYDFVKWNYDFTKPIMKNETIFASWRANLDTAYKAEYYLQNLEDDGYTFIATDNLTGTTDTTARAEIKSFEHFTYNAEKSTTSGNIDGNGSLVLKVYYTRDKYDYSVSTENEKAGTINCTANGKYKYDTTISLSTTVNAGYDFVGWFDGENKVSDELNYEFKLTQNTTIIAKWYIHTDTAYKTEYYLQNLADDNYTLTSTDNLSGTTDTTANAEIKLFEHFTYNSAKSTISGNINGNGNLVLKVYYTRDTYTVSVSAGNNVSATNAISGTYKYGYEYPGSVATFNNYLAYEWDGWYVDGVKTYDDFELNSFTVTRNIVITAQSNLKEGMQNFNFTTDEATCIINGVKDKTVTDITVPDCVTEIYNAVFEDCTKLISITLPFVGASKAARNGYDQVFGYIFGYKTTSSSSTISGATYQYYKNDTYYYYYIPSSLKSVTITGGDIPYHAFYHCNDLTSITIPDSVTSIGDDAFSGCSGLTSITIPDSVTGIGCEAFRDCSGLTRIDVSEWNTAYSSQDGILYNKAQTQFIHIPKNIQGSITIPDSVTSIGNEAFRNCIGLTSVTIGNSVTSIGYEAFRGCSGLTSVTIPDSVTSIDYYAFDGCSGLTSIYYTGDIASWCGISGLRYIMSSSRTLYIDGKKVEGELIIPEGVTSIGSGAFSGCTGLTSITIPDSVTSIGDSAFYGCSGLTSITIGNGVTSIGSFAFRGCSGFTSVTIGNSVTSIGSSAFYNCSGLTSITIPDSVTSIGNSAFSGCSGLTSITIPDSVTSIGNWAFQDCSGLTSVTIGNGVTSIRDWAFSGCCKLVEVYNKSSLNITVGSSDYGYVGYYAKAVYTEEYTSKLSTDENGYIIYTDDEDKILIGYTGAETELTLPEGITDINQGAFYGNNKITKVIIPDSVTSIGSCAFSGCSGLTSITIPDSVTSIGDCAFEWCSGLMSIKYGGTKEQWQAISKNAYWNLDTANYVIYCTDGTIKK